MTREKTIPATVLIKVVSWMLLLLIPINVFAASLDEATEKAAMTLLKNGLNNNQKMQLVVEVFNVDSNKKDIEARKIESSLFTALQSRFPNAKLLLPGKSIAGISLKAVVIKTQYRLRGNIITIELKALDKRTGQMIAKADVQYFSQKKIKKDLVAVLDIQADSMTLPQRKIYSKVFRTALINTDQFDLISGDEIDRADADKIQSEYQCSREECATIIAEQLAANQVITTVYGKVTDQLYYLTASLKNVSGETITEEKVKHDGNLNTFETALEQLACKLAKTCDGKSGEIEFVASDTDGANIKAGFSRITPQHSGNSQSAVATLILESQPPEADVFMNDSFGETPWEKPPIRTSTSKRGRCCELHLKKRNTTIKNWNFDCRAA